MGDDHLVVVNLDGTVGRKQIDVTAVKLSRPDQEGVKLSIGGILQHPSDGLENILLAPDGDQ
jgi:hypothetical protein